MKHYRTTQRGGGLFSAIEHEQAVAAKSTGILKLRDFKTIVGLVSFLADMGCATASIPLVEGARERQGS